jgi:hypothetical protein
MFLGWWERLQWTAITIARMRMHGTAESLFETIGLDEDC